MRNSSGTAPPASSVKALKVLASPVRLAVLGYLEDPVGNFPPQVDGDPLSDGICSDFLREKLGLAAATTSRHLSLLVEAGLLVATRKKGWTFYRRNEPRIREVAGLLHAEVLGSRRSLAYTHVDVFSSRAFNGNSLPVFQGTPPLSPAQLLRITQELRHFEAVFLAATGHPHRVRARVFDLFEELPFAGHPLIGAAAVLHHASGREEPQAWQLELATRTVAVATERTASGYVGWLDQGEPEFLGTVERGSPFAEAFGLAGEDLHPTLPLEVVSTGLRYLVVPLRPGALDRARVVRDLTGLVRGVGAQFAVLLDEAALEIRHWNNDGLLEDVATGSAAGVIGAYRLRHQRARAGEPFLLAQGRFTGRPSELNVRPAGSPEAVTTVEVGGDVTIVGAGHLDLAP